MKEINRYLAESYTPSFTLGSPEAERAEQLRLAAARLQAAAEAKKLAKMQEERLRKQEEALLEEEARLQAEAEQERLDALEELAIQIALDSSSTLGSAITKKEESMLQEIARNYLADDYDSDAEICSTTEGYFNSLADKPFAEMSPAFFQHPLIADFIKRGTLSVKLWYEVKNHLLTEDISGLHSRLDGLLARSKADAENGTEHNLQISSILLHNVHLSQNPKLIEAFSRCFQAPRSSTFPEGECPAHIVEKEKRANMAVEDFFRKNEATDFLSKEAVLNKVVLPLQRGHRAKARIRNEINRLSTPSRQRGVGQETLSASALIEGANTPYVPQCADPALSARLVRIAASVSLYQEVKHLTASNALRNIFDDALYGRKNLVARGQSFRNAALSLFDIDNGDGNAICLGFNKIDSGAIRKGTAEIIFDIDQMKKNPSVFFKQFDLGYQNGSRTDRELHKVAFPCGEIRFEAASQLRCQAPEKKGMKLWVDGWKMYANVPYNQLISYNVGALDQILALNFFRFLDIAALVQGDERADKEIINKFYDKLAKLSDSELADFLRKLGRAASSCGEFNIYAAHRIDFSSVISISSNVDRRDLSYKLVLKDFMQKLNEGKHEVLSEAITNVPGVFESQRFLAYLHSQVENLEIKARLQAMQDELAPGVRSTPKP